MLRTLIRLSDGTEISSGSDASMNIRSCTTTHCCNSGEELTIGSVCAACVEMVVQAPANAFKCEDTFTLFKIDGVGNETQIGVFNVQTPQKKGHQLWQVTAYDNVIKLDIDLTEWLQENVAYLNDPRYFVAAVCRQCGVTFSDTGFIYNEDAHKIPYFEPTGTITGRKLLQWVAQMLGYFCIADSDGNIRFAWYRDNTRVVLSQKGERYQLQGSYKRNNEILPVDGVQIMYSKASICQTPANIALSNPYIIRDNPILDSKTMLEMFDIADVIFDRLSHDRIVFECDGFGSLAACEVSTPTSLDVNVGDIIVVDEQDPGEQNTYKNCMRVMTKIQKGQKDTLYCTGSYRRRN